MLLYLLRHGIAENPGFLKRDLERELTSEGIARMQDQAVALQHMGLTAERLFCSSFVRAKQTAQIIGEALDLEPVEDPILRPGCSLGDLEEVLCQYEEWHDAFVVAHQPSLGEIVYQLTGSRVAMRQGTLTVVDLDSFFPGQGILHGVYAPDVLAAWGQRLRQVD